MRTALTITNALMAKAKRAAAVEFASEDLPPSAENKNSRNGILLLPLKSSAGVITLEIVNQLREELI